VAEDLLIGLRLASAGTPPAFERRAIVVSRFPETIEGTLAQKRRWVHGHLAIMRSVALPTLLKGLFRRDASLIAMALDVATPPLSLLAALHIATCLVMGCIGAIVGVWMPAIIASAGLAMLALFLVVGWLRHGRGRVGWRDAISLVSHALRIVGFGARFVLRDRSGWTRADRSKSRP
jgi:cellulose synthase/poly-beta-1,6-N-acetylglucosamine synthase-like glycosyltransferase